MKDLLTFFNSYWNLVIGLATTIILFVSKVVTAPNIELYFAESQVNYEVVIKIITICFTILSLILFKKYNQKSDTKKWFFSTILIFVLGIILFINYLVQLDKHTVYNAPKNERQVSGKTFLKSIIPIVDSITKAQGNFGPLDISYLVESTNSSLEIWDNIEVQNYSRILIVEYLSVVIFLYFFILCCIQSLYCAKNISNV